MLQSNSTQMQLFKHPEFGDLSVCTVGNAKLFPATSCARLLQYSNPHKAVRDHCKGVNVLVTPSAGGHQKTNHITIGDLCRLITHSEMPGADRFESWIFDEVLPAIFEQGYYSAVEREIYYEYHLQVPRLLTATKIASEYQDMSARALNKKLQELGVQYKDEDGWKLTPQYASCGYAIAKEYECHKAGKTVTTLYWTQPGRKFLKGFLPEHGVLLLSRPYADGFIREGSDI